MTLISRKVWPKGSSGAIVQRALDDAQITINGQSSTDPHVHCERVFERILVGGVRVVGESYMDGSWDVEDLAGMYCRVLCANADAPFQSIGIVYPWIRAHMLNLNTPLRARKAIQAHYDIGNDLYGRMLDPSMTYSCGYWKDAYSLAEAQFNKYELICRKLGLKKGKPARILDVGCGWGGFLTHAAREYGVTGVGVTLAENQLTVAKDRTRGLPITIRLEDYRYISDGPFDHIVSIGMFEHVGQKNYETFFKKMRSLLKSDGLFLLHTIGAPQTWGSSDPWYDRYIFRDYWLPSVAQIGVASNGHFILKDWHTFGHDYDTTMCAWYENFKSAWPDLKKYYEHRESGQFYRMWKFYLLSTAGAFRANRIDLWQMVFSPNGVPGGYVSVR